MAYGYSLHESTFKAKLGAFHLTFATLASIISSLL